MGASLKLLNALRPSIARPAPVASTEAPPPNADVDALSAGGDGWEEAMHALESMWGVASSSGIAPADAKEVQQPTEANVAASIGEREDTSCGHDARW